MVEKALDMVENSRARARGGPANGPGWGGPARGPVEHKPGPGRPLGMKNGEGKVHKARETLEQAAPLAIQTVIDIANDKADPRALQAALAVLNRIGLHEKSGIEMTGADGGAMITRIERVIVDKPGE
jgi:hypothetical protein